MHDQSWQQEVAQSSIVEPACIALYRYVEDELGSSIGSAAETAKRKNTMPSIAKGQTAGYSSVSGMYSTVRVT